MVTHRYLALAAIGAALGAFPAAAQSTPAAPPALTLTRRQAVDSALAHNPQIAVAREQVAEARAQATETAAFPDPSLSGDLTGQQSITGFRTNTGSDIGVGLALPFPTKFVLLNRVGNAGADAAAFNYDQLRQQTASQTAQAYDALIVTLRHRADLEIGDSLAHDFLKKTEARFAAGTVARLDVLKAQVALGQAENDLLANQRDLANARAALNRLMGRPLGFSIEAADSLAVPPDLPALDSLVRLGLLRRPELRGLASQRRGAGAATALAQQYWLPDLDLSVAKNMSQGTPATYTTGIGISLPLFFWNHQRGTVAESRHHERELQAAYTDLEAQVEQDVRVTYATAATALAQAIYIRDQLLPETRRAYDIAITSYGLGGSSALDVLDARGSLLDAESQYADALGAANDARADLERAVAGPFDAATAGVPNVH
ncbi:MAG TPA: TolC family protein [Gemmatimonadales bacterium]|nr:TolC family protein [Gemmatimonadales bacterium]